MKSKPCLNLTLRNLGRGKSVTVPFSLFKATSVRNAACLRGKELDRVFSVNVDWQKKVSIITRNA